MWNVGMSKNLAKLLYPNYIPIMYLWCPPKNQAYIYPNEIPSI